MTRSASTAPEIRFSLSAPSRRWMRHIAGPIPRFGIVYATGAGCSRVWNLLIMRKVLIEFSGIGAAAVVFWLAGVLLLPVVALVWPINGSNASDLALKP